MTGVHPEPHAAPANLRVPAGASASAPGAWTRPPLRDLLTDLPRNGYSPKEVAEYTGELMLGLGCLSRHGFRPAQLKNAPVGDRALEKARLADGDILLSRSNTRSAVGFVGIYRDVGAPCIYPDLMMLLRPVAGVLPEFLVRQLQSADGRRQIQALASGTSSSMVKLNRDSVLRLRVALPTPPEQRRIAEVLDTIDEAIRKTEEIIAKLKQVKQGLLHDLLTRGIDDNGELRDPDRHPEQFKDSVLGRIPKAWAVRLTPSLFTKVRPGPRQDARSCALGGPVPVLDQSADDLMGYFRGPAGVRASDEDPVVTFANHTCAVRWITYDCSAIQNVFFMRPASDVSARFLFYSIDGKVPQTTYRGHWPLLQESTSTVPPLEEQRGVERSLRAVDDRSNREGLWLTKLHVMKQGLMEDLLTGRIRVTEMPRRGVA